MENTKLRTGKYLLFLRRIFPVVLSILFLAPPALLEGNEKPDDEEMPFRVGERLTYNLRWGVISAGSAVLQVNPMAEVNGEEVYHFTLTVRTNSFVDRFYKVRDRMDGFVRKDLEGSVLYLVKKEAGRHQRDVRVVFDEEERMAQYSNFGEERDPVRVFPATFDPLSVVFAFRAMTMTPNSSHEIPVTDGRSASMGVGYIHGRESVRVPAGEFDTLLVEPDMQDVGGVFDRSDDAYVHIWFSDDERRIPVRVSSKVVVGSFRAELEEIEYLDLAETNEPVVEETAMILK